MNERKIYKGENMRVFDKFPKDTKCPLCKTNKEGKCVLIAIVGTNEDDGRTYEAVPVHLDCIELFYDKDMNMIYQKVRI